MNESKESLHYIPKDLTEAVEQLNKLLSSTTLKWVDQMKHRNGMIEAHLGLGIKLRNRWGLWHGSRLRDFFLRQGIEHADSMSGAILEALWDKRHIKERIP